MRALCGAIVTAGALIGLGLTAIGYGLRFQSSELMNPNSQQLYGLPTLMLILAVLVISVVIGTGIAFLGLAYHHERRFFEEKRARDLSSRNPPSGF